jgi:hypothetical protein
MGSSPPRTSPESGDSASGVFAGFHPPPPPTGSPPAALVVLCAGHLCCWWASTAWFFWPWWRTTSARAAPPRPTDALGRRQRRRVLIGGEWWRIVTAMFVHVGILHLATNMWCLWNLGLLAEPLMGSAGVLAVYILTGAAGNLLSTWSTGVANNLTTLGEWPPARRLAPCFSGRRGRIGRGLRHCRSADYAAQVASAAGASHRTAKAAQVGDLLCRHQPGDRLLDQLWHPRDRLRAEHRQHGPPGRLHLRIALCGSDGAPAWLAGSSSASACAWPWGWWWDCWCSSASIWPIAAIKQFRDSCRHPSAVNKSRALSTRL